MEWIWIAAIIVIALIVVIRNIRVVQQSQAYVIERLGAFSAVWGVGIHIKIPFLERVAKRVSLKEQVLDYPPSPLSPRTTSPCRLTPWFISRLRTPSCTPTVWSSL